MHDLWIALTFLGLVIGPYLAGMTGERNPRTEPRRESGPQIADLVLEARN